MFLIANAAMQNHPIVYCSTTFASEFGYKRQEVMEHDVYIDFMMKRSTNKKSIAQLNLAIKKKISTQIEIILYQKTGMIFFWSNIH